MSAAAVAARAAPSRTPLEVYRDDGPLARAVGRLAGRSVPAAGAVLVVAGAVPLVAALAIAGDDASRGAAAAVVAWAVLLGGLSTGRRDHSRMRWLSPPLLRLVEYAGLLWIAAIAGSDAVPGAFALLCAVAFRHYDLVYRLRHRGEAPPAWVDAVGLGWDGRLLLGLAALLAGALPEAFFAAASVLGAVFVIESVVGWTVWARDQGAASAGAYEDEEDEAQ